jgi:uncharacterized protein with FMN-binding domain
MKYITCLAFAATLLIGCAGYKTGNEIFFEGAAMGYRGMIHVRVGMENGTITEITVIESSEDLAIGGAAIEELTDLMLMYNTTEIDAVSGATETSRGFLEAVENAIFSP